MFVLLVVLMIIIGLARPRKTAWVQEDVKAIDMTPWKHAITASAILVVIVLAIYAFFADFSILS